MITSIAASRTRLPRGIARTAWRMTSRPRMTSATSVIDLLGLIGYFTTVSMVMNVAHTPPPDDPSVSPLAAFPR